MGSRGSSMFNSSSKKRHYSTLLLLALGAAMLSVLVLHKLREGRVFGLLLQDRERQLLTLQMILEKERVHSKEMKTKIEALKAKAVSLRTQKMQLNNRLMEAENLAAYLKNKRAELESALEEKQIKLTSLKDMEEASIKANLRVAALTDLLKQQQDHADEMERRLQQPSSEPVNATQVDDASKRNETDESTSKEEVAANRDDGTQIADGGKEVENSEHEQGSKRGEWVRLETNNDDSDSVDSTDDKSGEEEDHGKEEVSEEGKLSVEGIQVGGQNAVEVRDENQINRTELLLNTTMDGELPVMKDEVTSSNTTDTNVIAPEDGKVENKDDNADGEEKQTTGNTGTSIRGRRSHRTRTRGSRKRRAAARSREQNTGASTDSQILSSQHAQESSKMNENQDNQVLDRNATEMSSTGKVEPKLPEDQTASTEAEAAEQQTQATTVSLEASVGSDGDENSETKSASIESYQDTNGLEEKSHSDNKNGFDSGEQGRISSIKESNISEGARPEDGGPETTEENNITSTMEASEESAASTEGQTENPHSTEESESSGKEAEGSEQSGSEQLREKDEGDEEKKPEVSADSIQQEATATEIAEDGEVNNESRLEQERETGNSTEEKPGDENKAEDAGASKSEQEEAAEEDYSSNEDVKEF